MEKNGNALQDPLGEFENRNILYQAQTVPETASRFKKSAKEIEAILKSAREKLFEERSKRPRPHLDDKVLADWNGLMISSFSYASRVLQEERYLHAALGAANFIRTHLKDETGRLLHRYRDGEAAIPAGLDDYAFLLLGYLDLYEASFDESWLFEAKRLAEAMMKYFWDDEGGGLFMTASDQGEYLITRPKEFYDGAIPSGNSVAALGIYRLARMTQDRELEEKVRKIFSADAPQVNQVPSQFTQMLIAFDFVTGPSREIVIAGRGDEPEFKAMVERVFGEFLPNKVVLAHLENNSARISEIAPFLEKQAALKGRPTAYVCENYVCRLPVHDPQKLRELLR